MHGHMEGRKPPLAVLQTKPKGMREANCIVWLLEDRHKWNPLGFAWLEFLRKQFYLCSDWECADILRVQETSEGKEGCQDFSDL